MPTRPATSVRPVMLRVAAGLLATAGVLPVTGCTSSGPSSDDRFAALQQISYDVGRQIDTIDGIVCGDVVVDPPSAGGEPGRWSVVVVTDSADPKTMVRLGRAAAEKVWDGAYPDLQVGLVLVESQDGGRRLSTPDVTDDPNASLDTPVALRLFGPRPSPLPSPPSGVEVKPPCARPSAAPGRIIGTGPA